LITLGRNYEVECRLDTHQYKFREWFDMEIIGKAYPAAGREDLYGPDEKIENSFPGRKRMVVLHSASGAARA